MNSLVYTAKTQAEFRQLSRRHGGLQLIAELQDDELSSSASRWAFRHLLSFRLLTLPERTFLEILEDDHNLYMPCTSPKHESRACEYFAISKTE